MGALIHLQPTRSERFYYYVYFVNTNHRIDVFLSRQPLVKVTKLQPSSEPGSKPPPHISAPASATSKPVPSLSLRIPTARLKRLVPPSTGEGFDSMAVSPSPESAIQSDDLLSPYQPKAKKRKEERKHKKKHKHKERKRKHKHKRSSRESVDRDTTPMEL